MQAFLLTPAEGATAGGGSLRENVLDPPRHGNEAPVRSIAPCLSRCSSGPAMLHRFKVAAIATLLVCGTALLDLDFKPFGRIGLETGIEKPYGVGFVYLQRID